MLQRFYIFAIFTATMLLAAPGARAADSEGIKVAKALSNAYAEIAERLMPTVVAIEVVRNTVDDEEFDELPFNMPPEMKKYMKERMKQQRPKNQPSGMGSGILIDENGTILTNNHVVKDATKIKISLIDGTSVDGEIVGTDPKTDVAVIKVSKPERKFPFAVLGDSEKVKVGNIVLAIGAPFGLKESVTNGIVSAINRNRVGGGRGELGDVMYKNFIQTDATINPGNSGGPLVNLDGEVIGVNAAISTAAGGSDGVGFAIPSNMAKDIVKELLASGSVTRGWLGVGIEDFTPEMAAALGATGVKTGVVVRQTFPDTPAAKGGIRFGDILLTYNGTPLTDSTNLQNLVAKTPVGETAKIEVLRAGEKITLNVPIGRQPKKLANGRKPALDDEPATAGAEPEIYRSSILGIGVIALDKAGKEEQEAYKGLTGLVVTEVAPDSPAEDAALPKGALLRLINQKPIATVADLKAAEESLKGKTSALLHIQFGDDTAVMLLDMSGADKEKKPQKTDSTK